MTYESVATSARAWIQAGLAHHRSGRLEGAVHAYREALAVSPDDGDALNLLGTALLQLGALDEAVGYLERAACKQRNNPLVLANLGQAYIAAQRYGDAYESFRKANRLDPHELQFQLGMAAAMALLGKLSEAELALTRLASRFPNSPMVWFNLGNALRDQRRTQEAISAYEKALVLDANFAEAINNLGSVFHSTLKFDEAEERYRQCLTLKPDHLRARFNLASVVMDLGR